MRALVKTNRDANQATGPRRLNPPPNQTLERTATSVARSTLR